MKTPSFINMFRFSLEELNEFVVTQTFKKWNRNPPFWKQTNKKLQQQQQQYSRTVGRIGRVSTPYSEHWSSQGKSSVFILSFLYKLYWK